MQQVFSLTANNLSCEKMITPFLECSPNWQAHRLAVKGFHNLLQAQISQLPPNPSFQPTPSYYHNHSHIQPLISIFKTS